MSRSFLNHFSFLFFSSSFFFFWLIDLFLQGMNDLLSVFYTVFFWDYLKVDSYEEVSDFDVDSLPEQVFILLFTLWGGE